MFRSKKKTATAAADVSNYMDAVGGSSRTYEYSEPYRSTSVALRPLRRMMSRYR